MYQKAGSDPRQLVTPCQYAARAMRVFQTREDTQSSWLQSRRIHFGALAWLQVAERLACSQGDLRLATAEECSEAFGYQPGENSSGPVPPLLRELLGLFAQEICINRRVQFVHFIILNRVVAVCHGGFGYLMMKMYSGSKSTNFEAFIFFVILL